MPEENNANIGWGVIASWQFVAATVIISSLAIVGTWVTQRKFDPVLLQIIVMPVLIFLILSWCTLLYSKFSKKLNESSHDLNLLRNIIRDISLSKAIDERKWLIHGDEVRNNEASDNVRENWTLTPDFHYEVADFQRVVIDNFKKNLEPGSSKTKYEYIYPDTDVTKQRLDEFRKIVVNKLVEDIKPKLNQSTLMELNRYVKLYPIKENIVPLTEGIHNPKDGSLKMGLLMTPEEDFPFYIKLSPSQTDALIIKFRQLKTLSKKEQGGNMGPLFLTEEIIAEYI